MIPIVKSVTLMFLLSLVVTWAPAADAQETFTYEVGPTPIDNPLKGLVPYVGEGDAFGHSMEFQYFSLAELMVGEDQFRWEPLDQVLEEVSSRGKQLIFRVYLEYPGRKDALPLFLRQQGVKIHRYRNREENPPVMMETPDYQDPRVVKAMTQFLTALGERYDGDARIAFITAGMLGAWGEWHTYPREDLFASKEVQTQVLQAYQKAFKKTAILLRYPAGPQDDTYVDNTNRPFGYHDDSFAWATLATGRDEDSWYFQNLLNQAGTDAVEKWKRYPIGGEIRPEAWGKVFDKEPGKKIQSFDQCVRVTHVSWLMDTGMFEKRASEDRRKNAEAAVRKMGYEFHIRQMTLQWQESTQRWKIRIECENRGVAPFYYNWPIQLAFQQEGQRTEWESDWKLTGILPGQTRVWEKELGPEFPKDATGIWLGLRVENPMKGGKAMRFANKTQDRHHDGWMTLKVN